MNNHIRVVERLLDAQANPLAVAKNNWTPMLMAFRQGHMECGRLLERTATELKRKTRKGSFNAGTKGAPPRRTRACRRRCRSVRRPSRGQGSL
jgi:hypothetical protein